MARFELTNKAVEDLTAIWEYTVAKWSEQQAERYYRLIIQRCEEIANNPNLGKHYEGIRNDLFGLRISRHIIFYRKQSGQPIEITRILHARMDLKNRVNE